VGETYDHVLSVLENESSAGSTENKYDDYELAPGCLLCHGRCSAALDKGGDFDWGNLRDLGFDEVAAHLVDTDGEFDLETELAREIEASADDDLVTLAELKRVAEATKSGKVTQQDLEDQAAARLLRHGPSHHGVIRLINMQAPRRWSNDRNPGGLR
jgi:hypothetical protein